jgi:acyl dehydratase
MAETAAGGGRRFAPVRFNVEREQIRRYASAVGEVDACYHDLDAARRAGMADIVAPPMFAVVYCAPAMALVYGDPELSIDFEMLLHTGQEFEWGPLVLAGDVISTEVTVTDIRERVGMRFYVFESYSRNQRDEVVSRGLWTNVVRPRT